MGDADQPHKRGKTVHGSLANAGHRVLAPDDAEVEAYLEVALDAPAPMTTGMTSRPPAPTSPPAPSPSWTLAASSHSSSRAASGSSTSTPSCCRSTPPWPSWSAAVCARSSCRAVPNSVYDEGAPHPDSAIWSGRIPVLGICYGAQLMAVGLGGDVLPTSHREYGPATLTITADEGCSRVSSVSSRSG